MVVELNDGNLEETIKKYPLVLVDFWAEWCMPCRWVAPVVEQLAKEYEKRLLCAKLNVDENPQSAAQFEIMSIPSLLLFKNGKLVEKIVGAVPKSHIEARLKPYL